MRGDKKHPLMKKVEDQFADGRMDRREFLRYSTLLGVSAMTAYSMAGLSPAAHAASMPRGGTIRIGHVVITPFLEPHNVAIFIAGNVIHAQNQTLTRTGADNVTRPLLCKSWHPSEDLRTWTIRLHENAVWTDGSPLVADHVIANFERLLDPATGSGTYGLMSYMLKEVEKDGQMTKELWDANALEKVDDHTVNFNLASPQVALPEHLYNYPSSMGHPEDDFRFGPGKRGTGPYQCVEFVNREKAIFEAKRPYWGREGHADRIEFVDIGSDQAAVFAALASKQIDGHYEIGPDQADALAARPHLEVYSKTTGQCPTLSLRMDHEPWGDNRIRQAMKLATEPDKLTKLALRQWGTPGENHHVSEVHPEYVKLPEQELDIAKAKELMAEAGYPDGFDADVTTVNDPAWILATAQGLKQQLERIGIRLKINPVTLDAFWGLWDKDPVVATWWAHRPLAIQIMALVYRSNTAWNIGRWNNPEFDEVLQKAEGTVDVEERKVHVKRIEEILQSEGPMLQPMFVNAMSAWDKRVKGFEQHPSLSIFIEDIAIEA